MDGVANEINSNKTAWAHRDATWSMVIGGIDPDPANKDKLREWATKYCEALHPYSTGAGYVNFMMEEGRDRVEATYGEKYKQLQKIKARYDPDNFFHVNQNIQPDK